MQMRQDGMQHFSPLPTSDAIISLGGQPQPDTSQWLPAQGGTDALSLSAGLDLSSPGFTHPSSALAKPSQDRSGEQSEAVNPPAEGLGRGPSETSGLSLADGSSTALGHQRPAEGQAALAKPIGRPMGRPASMQPAALIRAAREKAAAAAAAAAAPAASPAAAAQSDALMASAPAVLDLQQGSIEPPLGGSPVISLQQTTPFGHPSQQNQAVSAGQPAASDLLGTPASGISAPQPSRSSVLAQEHSAGMQLAGGGDSEGISLTGPPGPASSLPKQPSQPKPLPADDAPEHAKDAGVSNRQGQVTDGDNEAPAVSVSSVKAGSQGLEPGASIPGPAPPAGSPGGGTSGAARRVPGPRPPPGAPPPRPPPPGETLYGTMQHSNTDTVKAVAKPATKYYGLALRCSLHHWGQLGIPQLKGVSGNLSFPSSLLAFTASIIYHVRASISCPC